MNRQWMYGSKHTSEYIKGMREFLEVAEANKQNGFMCCCHLMNGITSLENDVMDKTHPLA